MTAAVRRLLRVGLTVTDLPRLSRFYEEALGFAAGPEGEADAAFCRLLGARRARTRLLRLGAEEIELAQLDPPGPPYPAGSTAADLVFQHCALVTPDIARAYARLDAFRPEPISRGGPVRLPDRSGGVTAFKFRDPDGHPLELIQFPDPRPPGIDHSAIVAADVGRSIAFYEGLGLRTVSRQVNTGAEQEALDGLDDPVVDVVGLAAPVPALHVELLGYRAPRPSPAPRPPPDAVAASRLVMEVVGLDGAAALAHDPDGHALLLCPAERRTPSRPSPPGPRLR